MKSRRQEQKIELGIRSLSPIDAQTQARNRNGSESVDELLSLFLGGHPASFALSEKLVAITGNQAIYPIPQNGRDNQKQPGCGPNAPELSKQTEDCGGTLVNLSVVVKYNGLKIFVSSFASRGQILLGAERT